MTDAYDSLVKKSVIRENYAEYTHDELRTSKLIPCDKIENFYYDTLFYLHFHYSLYLELLYYNHKNDFNIEEFSKLWNKLKIKFINDNSATLNIGSYNIRGFNITERGAGYTGATVIINSRNTNNGLTESIGTATIVSSGFPKEITSLTNELNESAFIQNGDVITFNAPSSGTSAVGRIITTDNSRINKIEIIEPGSSYTNEATITLSNILNYKRNGFVIATPLKTLNFTLTTTGYINTASVTSPSVRYNSDILYDYYVVDPTTGSDIAKVHPITNITNIGNISDNTFSFDLSIFKNFYNNIIQYQNDYERANLTKSKTPEISNITYYTNTNIPNLFTISKSDRTTELASSYYSKSDIISTSSSTEYNDTERTARLDRIILDILNQDVKNILGYLAYQIRYYNIIILNTSIQRMIYKYYLNNNEINMNVPSIFLEGQSNRQQLNNILTHIDNMKNNLTLIQTNIKKTNNYFSESKELYPDRIITLNINEENYIKSQDALNNTAKNYNQYYNNYNKLKLYASSIIIFLIILVIATVIITILPYFNANSKNTYYILILILLIILTVLFYNNFSHINLYENFTTMFDANNCSSNKNRYNTNSKIASLVNANRQNNYDFFNTLSEKLISYNKAYADVNSQMSSAIYTTDSQAFEKDANNYLSKMYIEKKRKIDLFKTKRTSLINLIEAMKQQIIYLYNIILIICLLTIVLLITLLLYVNMPQFMNLIIAFASISIFIIIIYYIYAVVQPTRLIANKKYWANKNPSIQTYNKL